MGKNALLWNFVLLSGAVFGDIVPRRDAEVCSWSSLTFVVIKCFSFFLVSTTRADWGNLKHFKF